MENTAGSTGACRPAVAGNAFLWVKNSTTAQKYCRRHKCVHCCRKAVRRGRLRRRGYCRTHTCHTDFCGAGTMSKGARSCKRHKCAYCNSAVIGVQGGLSQQALQEAFVPHVPQRHHVGDCAGLPKPRMRASTMLWQVQARHCW